VIGLIAKVLRGLVGGDGGTVIGLATAQAATAAIAATKTTPRILIDLEVIAFYSRAGESTAHTKSNPKGSFALPQK